MKKMSELMAEIGFNPEGSEATKEAFIKHLIYVSTGQRVATPSEKKEIEEYPQKIKILTPLRSEQLAFDFMDEVVKKKKA